MRDKRVHTSRYKLGAAKGEGIMTEANRGGDRSEMERRLINRSLEDETFRQSLLDDPKGTIEQEFGSRLPVSIEVRVVQESTDTIYLVLPSRAAVAQGGELSDQELEKVSGGGTVAYLTISCCGNYSLPTTDCP